MKTGKAFILSGFIALADTAVKGFVKEPPVKNYGFAGNRYDDHPETVARVSAALAGVMAVALILAPEKLKLPMALVLGGALSNSADRLIRGYVVDYIPMGKGYYGNISDFAIFLGAAAGSVMYLMESDDDSPSPEEPLNDIVPS